MKKVQVILIILLAFVFTTKNLVSYADTAKSTYCVVDSEDAPSSEEGEKDSQDSKEKCDEWMISDSGPDVLNVQAKYSFLFYQENTFVIPYFEITSPPPRVNFFA